MQEECPQFFVNRIFWQSINQHCLRQSMEFSRPEYWSRKPFTSPGDLPNPGIEPRSPAWQADSLPAEPQSKPKNTGVGQPIPSPGDLPNPGIKLGSPAFQEDSLPTQLSGKPLILQSREYSQIGAIVDFSVRHSLLPTQESSSYLNAERPSFTHIM